MKKSAAPAARRADAGRVLPASWYDRDTEHVARELLGAVLQCRSPRGIVSGRIVETEAYLGPHDPACHAAAGRTDRNEHLHGPPGTSYVYFIYGMHWCVNAVTREAGYGSAVLIRALEPLTGLTLMRERRGPHHLGASLTNGPGKLCEALGITREHDGLLLYQWPLRIVAGELRPAERVGVSSRIGIRQAADWPLRFFIEGHHCLSRGARVAAAAK